jgi:hypothetical protein
MEQQMLDLDVPSPRHPGLVLYNAWAGLLDFYGDRAGLGDRVRIQRSDEESGEITLFCERGYNSHFSIFPDGSFELRRWLCDRWGWWQRHTFFNIQWAIRQRVVMISPMERQARHWLNERDWRNPEPYLDPGHIRRDVRYELVLDDKNHWIVRVPPSHITEATRHNQQALDNGYAFAQARYDRFQHRAENRGTLKARNRLAMHTANGHVTGAAAVEQMASLLHVHAPKEAQEGS